MVAAAILIVGVACLAEGVRLALLVMCCIGICAGLLCEAVATEQGSEHAPWTVSASVFGGVLGFIWEETWRGQYYQSLWMPCVVALLLLTCAFAWLYRKQGVYRLIPFLLPGLILTTYGLGLCAGLFVCCVALAVFGWYAETRECAENGRPLVPDVSMCDPALFVAAGTGTGVYLVNAAGSQAAMLGSAFVRTIFSVTGWVVGIVLCVLIIGALLHEACRRRETELALYIDEMPFERMRGYLVSRGLGQLQVDVTMLCIEGVGVSEIARRLNFARGTVDRARHDAFHVLGVCNRMQLLQKIQEDIFI
jgi:DNA-binding CsgD family transcriptional regulator